MKQGRISSRDYQIPDNAARRHLIALICALSVPAISLPLPAHALQWSGYLESESTFFLHDSDYIGQSSANTSLSGKIQLFYDFELPFAKGDNTLTFTPFFRIDQHDDRRSHVDFRELNWLHVGDDWELRAGMINRFWGVAESNHLIDILNQTDSIESIDQEEKLGQPAIEYGTFQDWGTVRLFALPGFRERTFAGQRGRLRGDVVVNTNNTEYESGAENHRLDWLGRYSHTFNEWDVGLYHFHGTSREPRLVPSLNETTSSIELSPHYDIIDQTGLDLQATYESWLWKIEAIYRSGHGRSFAAATGGVEYTFYDVAESGYDIGTLIEYQWDDRSDFAPATLADNDLFIGGRMTFNNVQDTAILAGGVIDANDGTSTFLFEAETRIGDSWKLEVSAYLFTNVDQNNLANGLRNDDHIRIQFARYF